MLAVLNTLPPWDTIPGQEVVLVLTLSLAQKCFSAKLSLSSKHYSMM